jgi:Protein of unknown function (DUF1579)
MKKIWSFCLGAAVVLMALPLSAQQTLKEAEREAGTREQYDKILRQSGNHEILARLEGTWQGTHKVLGYGTPFRENQMKDTLEVKSILNGNFFEAHFTSEIAGFPNKGMVMMGYNGADKEFWRLYMNEADPRGIYSTGVYVRSKDMLVFRGIEHDPVSGDKFEKRDVFIFGPDKDKLVYELHYAFADGSELKVIDGTYTRAKAK